MIDSLVLENWKTHKRSTFNFRKGTNVLVGVIGSGKSSVLDGICYGLYGTFPALKSSRVSSEDLLTRKPSTADIAKIEVCFSKNGKKYKVERVLKRNGINEGRLYADETLIAGPKPTQTTERVEQELGVSYELFVRGVYSEQNQVDYFLKLNPGERKKKFDELLDLQKYEIVRNNANQVALQFKRKQENDAAQLAQLDLVLQQTDVNELRSRHAQQSLHLKELQSQKVRVADELVELAKKKMKMEDDWKVLKLLKEKQQQLHAKQQLYRDQVAQFESENPSFAGKTHADLQSQKQAVLERYRSLIEKQKQHQMAELRLQKAIQKEELLQKNHHQLLQSIQNRTIEEVEFVETQILGQLSSCEQKIGEKESLIQESKSKSFALQEKLKHSHEEEKNLASLHASCATCKQTISNEHKQSLLLQLHAQRTAIQNEQQSLSMQTQSLVQELQLIKNELKENQSKQQSIAVLKSKCAELLRVEKELETAKNETITTKAALTAMGNTISQADLDAVSKESHAIDLALQNALRVQELGKIGLELDSNQKQMEWFSISESDVVAISQEHTRMHTQLQSFERELIAIEQALKDLHARLQGMDLMQKEKERMLARLQRSKEVEEAMRVWGNALISTQQQLREWVLEAVNLALQELWPQVYPYRDYIHAQLVADENDYVLRVQERLGNWVDVESSLSGGERSAAALTLRMAIAFVLTRQLSWMILDEPTHNLDTKSVGMLSQMLRERLPGLVDQIFVITHNPEIEKSATGSLYLLQREKNEDGMTIPVIKTIDHGTRVE
ncbi:MAG: SMC family ATPase [Candidatus Iainarchaeum archaeon]|uniref:SMC family ATPase n=1 Tax=Candidatus Iainarchaeum sp. TaxID=3101447 RepID=A0A7T9I1T5_9ARCH|nr:MAG: SMC family ATPase [Candidatus Diapherotrites archaeon]